MSEETKKAPAIRFQGFSDAWEQRKLIEEADFFDEKRIPIDSEKRVQGRYPYYGATGVIDYVDNYIFDGEYILLAEDGANIITRNSPVAYITEGKFWLNNHAHIMKMKLGSNLFLLQLLERQNYEKFNSGTAQPKLNGQIVKNMIFNFPSYKEQNKIGNFFKLIDEAIALHQRQLNKYSKLKKALLQKMFPKSGEKSPEIRFDGFEEEWKQCKLGQIVTERNQQVPESIDYPLMSFTATDGVTPKSDRYNREFLVKSDNKKYKKTELGDLIYSSNNLDVGSIGINKTGNAVISPVYSIFYTRDGVTPEFVDMLIQRKDFINKMTRFRQGVVYGQWRIHESDFLEIETRIPSSKEQIKMGSLFKQIDNTIAFHQQKVNDYQKLKEGILKKMFI